MRNTFESNMRQHNRIFNAMGCLVAGIILVAVGFTVLVYSVYATIAIAALKYGWSYILG